MKRHFIWNDLTLHQMHMIDKRQLSKKIKSTSDIFMPHLNYYNNFQGKSGGFMGMGYG